MFRSLSAIDFRRLQCVQKDFAKIGANTTKYSHIIPVRKTRHWLPIKHLSVFKTALLVYKYLHSGYPKYFEPFLKARHSVHRTRRGQSDGMLVEIPHFASDISLKKHFGLSFASDAPRIWYDLPDDVYSAKPLFIQEEVENLSLCKSISTLVFWSCLCLSLWRQPLQCFTDYDLCLLVLCAVESVNKWRLSATKVLLEVELT